MPLSQFDRLRLKLFVEYIETTKEDEWCLDVVMNKHGQACLLGHVFIFGGNKLYDWFESMIATSYMVYPVNDGENSKYTQSTPKQRSIQYLTDIINLKEPSSCQLWEEMDSLIHIQQQANP